MKQSELTFCANRADVLKRKIRHAKGVVNTQRPGVVLEALVVAEDIIARLKDQLPDELRDLVYPSIVFPAPDDEKEAKP